MFVFFYVWEEIHQSLHAWVVFCFQYVFFILVSQLRTDAEQYGSQSMSLVNWETDILKSQRTTYGIHVGQHHNFARLGNSEPHFQFIGSSRKNFGDTGFSVCQDSSKYFTCNSCSYSTKSRPNMLRHQRKHSGETFRCPLCDRKFYDKYERDIHHQAVHFGHNFPCGLCGKTFLAKASLYRHQRTVHSDNRWNYKNICSYCGKKFNEQSSLANHILMHTKL